MDFERRTTVGAPAEALFELLADPARLAAWVPVLEHVETEVEEETEAGEAAGSPGFLVDRAASTITWGAPEAGYGGSVTVKRATASLSDVTIRLRTRDDVDREQVQALVEQAARSIGRLANLR